MRILNFAIVPVLISLVLVMGCKKDKEDEDDPSTSDEAVLVITTGAQTVKESESISFTASVVDAQGNVTAATGVEWKVKEGSAASISSGGAVTILGIGIVTIEASVTHKGKTLTASVPLSILSDQLAFAVVPGALAVPVGTPDISLNVVYLGTEAPTFSYESSNSNVASVSSSGSVSFHAAGTCVITVNSTLSNNPSVQVPVLVVGAPSLPVARVDIYQDGEQAGSVETFRNTALQLSAKAFDASEKEVSASFSWSVHDGQIATVDQSGKLTGKSIGRTTVQATASGIIGQAEVYVYPDSVLIVTPFFVQNVQAGSSHQLNAALYKVNHSTLSLESSPIQDPATGVAWEVLPTRIDPFNPLAPPTAPATVSSSGLVTVKQDVTMGDLVIVVAGIPNTLVEPGASTLLVGF